MRKEEKDRRHVLVPCAGYDVEGMESWLSQLGESGWFLAKDGLFAGVATLEKGDPRPVRYRLEGAKKSTSLWSENSGEPDQEQVELSRKYSWDYWGKWGEFHLYRSLDPHARELNTDPQVQALSLKNVKKRRWTAFFQLLFWALLYPIALAFTSVLLVILQGGTWFFLLTLVCVIWMLANALADLSTLGKQIKAREKGIPLLPKPTLTLDQWKRRAWGRFAKNTAQWLLVALVILLSLAQWGRSTLGEDRVPLDQYQGTLPFATMENLVSQPVTCYQETMTGLSLGFQSLREWSDWLAPRCVDYGEHAKLTLSDKTVVNGGYYVEYYETAHPLLAKILVWEWENRDRKKGVSPLEVSHLQEEEAWGYTDYLHFPTLILRRGSLAVRAQFYQTGPQSQQLSWEEWTQALCDSLPG